MQSEKHTAEVGFTSAEGFCMSPVLLHWALTGQSSINPAGLLGESRSVRNFCAHLPWILGSQKAYLLVTSIVWISKQILVWDSA